MALSVTHFPGERLTFALIFGPSSEQQGKIISRLRRAGADTAHPMLLPGILAELEHGRQMEAVDDLINELEAQLTRIGQETVLTWQLSSETKAERNWRKTEAYLNATFSKNILSANVTLLHNMRRHLAEFQGIMCPAPGWRPQHVPQYDLTHPGFADWSPVTSQSIGSTGDNVKVYHYDLGAENLTREATLTAEPDSMHNHEAKYQDAQKHASMRMADRFAAIIAEYDDKIRHCTMEVNGMAMATQWVSPLYSISNGSHVP